MAVSIKGEGPFYGFGCYWKIENFSYAQSRTKPVFSSQNFRINALPSEWQISVQLDKNKKWFASLHRMYPKEFFNVNVSLFLLKFSTWKRISTMSYKSTDHGWLTTLPEEDIFVSNRLSLFFYISNDQMKNESSLCLMFSRLTFNLNLQHEVTEIFSNLNMKQFVPFPPSFGKVLEDQRPREAKDPLIQENDIVGVHEETQTDISFDFKHKNELLKLFEEEEFKFVTLRTSDRDFSVCKAVLCAKSPVFSAMFERKMKEHDSNLVDIKDIDSETMTKLIQFLHFEPLENLSWEQAIQLYYSADKYQIDTLKVKCVSFLKNDISVENICNVFILADQHQDEDLMNCAQKYFCLNSKLVFPTKNWKDLIQSYPELIAQILCKFGESM